MKIMNQQSAKLPININTSSSLLPYHRGIRLIYKPYSVPQTFFLYEPFSWRRQLAHERSYF